MNSTIIQALLRKLQINIKPECPELFISALTHKSYLADEQNLHNHYDRLEFLGDSVLKTVINSHLYQKYPDYPSGELTKLSAYLLSDKALTQIASSLDLSSLIRSERRIPKSSILADVSEAIIAACYLNYGLETTQEMILGLYDDLIEEADASDLKENYKAALQEYTQSQGLGLPTYITIKQDGPAHSPRFELEVRLGDQILGHGIGKSKKDASQKAAQASLLKLQTHE